ncbi:MAG: HDIG domain-containing protein [Candidatus Aenigmarchaeota archaeon]|nr:HDIG domain-containing protein [Candidatus Aenigmarchaeota archaeon]
MKQLIELANKIKDGELRKKVVEFIREPKLSHKDFKKYPSMKIEEAKSLFSVSSPSGMATVERDVLNHSIALADLCLKTAETIEKNYKIQINKDNLIAASILHDLMKIFEYKKEKEGLEHTGILLDHSMLAVAEFYHRGFPEEVIHIIASHFGEAGPTPPRNFEALIFHYCDTLLSLVEFHLYGAKVKPSQPVQLVLFDEEALKKIIERQIEKD